MAKDYVEEWSMDEPADGVARRSSTDVVLAAGWCIVDHSGDWWSVVDGEVFWSSERGELEQWIAWKVSGKQWAPGIAENIYGEGPVWAIRRSPHGLAFVSSDGHGIDIFHRDREMAP